MIFTHQDRQFNITRYPETTNRSLRAWNAGDEYMLLQLGEMELKPKTVAIYNDRFGFLGATLHHLQPFMVIDRKSQQKSLQMNLDSNQLEWNPERLVSPLSDLPETVDIGIIHIPKTLDLFRLYLNHLTRSLADDGLVICSFMTKYFSPQMLDIAGEFFEDVEQSLARKKARVLILRKKKNPPDLPVLNSIEFSFDENHTEKLKQYFGVFSGSNIDYATQFLMKHLKVEQEDQTVLDMASGNGVIARAIQLQKPDADIHLLDDSLLAIESSKQNLNSENAHFHWNDTLHDLDKDSFDLVVSNPPFHFEHETNIEVSIELFQEVFEVLKPGGRFICVANQHLNYKTHLDKIFKAVEVIAQNKKFILYKSLK